MLCIIVSRADSASVHIGEQLLDLTDWEERDDDTRPDGEGGGTVYCAEAVRLREFDDLHLDLERPADAFDDPTLVVFASRHSGETGPLLTAHHTGNFGPADHGGRPNELARACPGAHRHVLASLETHAPDGYEVGMEATHHGPSEVGAPSMFVEVGSSEPHWEDSAAGRAVANAILDLRGVAPDRPVAGVPEDGTDGQAEDQSDLYRRQLVGFGGGHYTPRFERVVRETEWAVGHVAPDWGLAAMGNLDDSESRAVLAEAFEQSRAAYALVDGDRPDIERAVEELGYRAVSETWVRETDGVDLGFVRRVEAVCEVDDGLRFGNPARTVDESVDWTVTSLPVELLEEATGIDREATWAAVAETALAFGTEEGGTRPTNPVVLAESTTHEPILDALIEIVRERYDTVERDGDTLVARETRFDPDRARTLGVSEGPAFGKLAAGKSVEIGGETIPPEVVRSERVERFSLVADKKRDTGRRNE